MPDNTQKILTVTSPSFQDNGFIPVRYTGEGENLSPGISWEGVPEKTASLVLIMEDRDIPFPRLRLFTWVHWIVYNITPDMSLIPEALPVTGTPEIGVFQGKTSYKINGYSGPKPVSGTHSYHFTVYALDVSLDLDPETATKKKILKAIDDHILAKGTLTGVFHSQKHRV